MRKTSEIIKAWLSFDFSAAFVCCFYKESLNESCEAFSNYISENVRKLTKELHCPDPEIRNFSSLNKIY